MLKPMALLVFKFLRLKKSFLFRDFPEDKELEFHLLRMAGTLGCLSHSSVVRFIAGPLSKLLSPKVEK